MSMPEPFLFEGDVDGRFTAMTRVVGVETDDGSAAAAFPLLELRDRGVLTTSSDAEEIVAFWVPGSTSALDAGAVGQGVDVGATGVFSTTCGRPRAHVLGGDRCRRRGDDHR